MINIIVPIYNEENRVQSFLSELIQFCTNNSGAYRITFVNDGSTDNTLQILQPFISTNDFVSLISYVPNRGKGFAVKKAMLDNDADHAIFIDSDGSISPDEIPEMVKKLGEYEVVVGSRALKESKPVQQPIRKFIGVIFNVLTNMIFWTGIEDNLCGLKGFRKNTAVQLFSKLKTNRWIFDVELFYRIKKEKISLYEMPIAWEHKTGSKIKLYDPLIMFFNLLTLRLKLLFE